jgi:hypothetical protein
LTFSSLTIAFQRIRDGSLEWLIVEYEGKEKVKVTNSGSGNFDEFKVKRLVQTQPAALLVSPMVRDPSLMIASASGS